MECVWQMTCATAQQAMRVYYAQNQVIPIVKCANSQHRLLSLILIFLVYTICDESPCQNGGECRKHVLDYICDCPVTHSGEFCENGT